MQRTVYCKGFEKLATTLDDLIAFFSPYDAVNVMRRTYVDRVTKGKPALFIGHHNRSVIFLTPILGRHFKGSVFVTFKTRDAAESFLKLESVKAPGSEEVLIRKWQSDYNEEKRLEYEEK